MKSLLPMTLALASILSPTLSANEVVPLWPTGTAFVLKYPLPRTPDADFLDPVPLSDALRAIQWVRSNAGDFGIDPARIGILGFSAGGHLAASAGTRYSQAREFGGDDLSKVSARPDFVGLVYPVISSDPAIRHGCFATLLPANSPQSALDALSPEKLVTADTPQMFLVHAKNDKGVAPENSEVLHKALERVGVPSEIHLYEQGGHGFGLGAPAQDCSQWPAAFVAWLGQGSFVLLLI